MQRRRIFSKLGNKHSQVISGLLDDEKSSELSSSESLVEGVSGTGEVGFCGGAEHSLDDTADCINGLGGSLKLESLVSTVRVLDDTMEWNLILFINL